MQVGKDAVGGLNKPWIAEVQSAKVQKCAVDEGRKLGEEVLLIYLLCLLLVLMRTARPLSDEER